jgi:2,3-bisphosphoglycerate-independent phosphoglycerate mutase
MIGLEQIQELAQETPSKIVLLVIDGLGGLSHPKTGKTEMESAHTPHLDRLAGEGICGLIDPVSPGITPGSAPGHLGLFGYDPLKFTVGRGVMEALGIDFDLKEGDVAARGNFCTVNEQGVLVDRRAGRISTDTCAQLCRQLSQIKLDGVELFVVPVREHRFALVLRGEGLGEGASDSDPQHEGVPPLPVKALSPAAESTVKLANTFIARAREILADSRPANMIMLRGFSQRPNLSPMSHIYRLKPAAIAAYPMYRGLAKLVGMDVLPTGTSIEEEFATLAEHYQGYNFFFLHIKAADAAGEDGDFERKVGVIEELDAHLPKLVGLNPEVIVVTGDHSTPALLKQHSWHPVPILLRAATCRRDGVAQFSESACIGGGLGRFRSVHVMPLALAHAGKLNKYGA